MAGTKALLDEYGIIHEAVKILPSNELKIKFLESLAELEDNTAHFLKQDCTRLQGLNKPFIVLILTK